MAMKVGGRREMREGPGASPASSAPVPVVPFDQASKTEVEFAQIFSAVKLGTGNTKLGPIALPANGYVRNVVIIVETEVAGEKGEAGEDYPFILFPLVRLTEPNGAPLGAELKGFNLFLGNLLGGYAGSPDVRTLPDFKEEANKPAFMLRIPVEIAPTGLGALGNQSAAAALRLTLELCSTKELGVKAEATSPTLKITVLTELWGEPPAKDVIGRPCQQNPPYEGTAQQWSELSAQTITKGNNNIKHSRVGSMLRTLIWSTRNAENKRVDKAFPEPWQLQLDNRIFKSANQTYLRSLIREQVSQLVKRPPGIFGLSFSLGEGRTVGENPINSWLATLTATRLELLGPAEEPGVMDILTNDISVTAVNPEERTLQVGTGGYHPPIGETTNVAG